MLLMHLRHLVLLVFVSVSSDTMQEKLQHVCPGRSHRLLVHSCSWFHNVHQQAGRRICQYPELRNKSTTTTTTTMTTTTASDNSWIDLFFPILYYSCVIENETIYIENPDTLSGPWCCADDTCTQPDTSLTGDECKAQIEESEKIEEVVILQPGDGMDRRYKPCRISFEVDANGYVAGVAHRG
mmetsp:Transcript_2428/g.3384  ORF Transcript_2428/g.3384 Transcript_2428/m.3384 type:complete len:183 (+) Transcript_2428:455-1003(+)